jgi:copper(I)-binding protein
MKTFLLIAVFSAVFSFDPLPAKAKAPKDLIFKDARIFMPIKGGFTTAGYALIRNQSEKDIQLSIVETLPFKAVEAHETTEKDGKMSMFKVDYLLIKPKEQFELKPGASHLMFFDTAREIKLGETLMVKFSTEKNTFEIPFKVIPRLPKPDEPKKY